MSVLHRCHPAIRERRTRNDPVHGACYVDPHQMPSHMRQQAQISVSERTIRRIIAFCTACYAAPDGRLGILHGPI